MNTLFKHMWNEDSYIISNFEIYIIINSPTKTIVFKDTNIPMFVK